MIDFTLYNLLNHLKGVLDKDIFVLLGSNSITSINLFL